MDGTTTGAGSHARTLVTLTGPGEQTASVARVLGSDYASIRPCPPLTKQEVEEHLLAKSVE